MKVIFFDLDGTLLNEDSLISETNHQWLMKVHQKGIQLGIASGRPISTIEKKIKEWNMDGIITLAVGMNGSHIKNLENGELEELSLMPSEGINELLDLYADLPCEPMVCDEEHVYMQDYTFFTNWICENDYLTYVQTDFTEERKKSWPKACIISEPELLPQMLERYQKFNHPEMIGTRASDYTIEFTHSDINKGFGIKKLCEELGVSMSDVMAFGDANNDLSMFEVVGHPICMLNGTPEAKALAKEITKYDNTQDGVARYLEEHWEEL